MRVMIVDDEPMARKRLAAMLAGEKDIEAVYECRDGPQALETISREKPDLVLLDIQMPEMDGFDVLTRIPPESMPEVIFVTAFDRYALDAFACHAIDYLLKPVDGQRLSQALDLARRRIQADQGTGLNAQVASLVAALTARDRYQQRFSIKADGRIFICKSEEILWLEAKGKNVCAHLEGKSHVFRDTLNNLETRLDPQRFLRLHRSYIVNLDFVKEVQRWFNHEMLVILKDGTKLQVSRNACEKLKQVLF